LKDYVYVPLGGSRCKKARHYFNLLVTFGISGVWHGADWHFIVWGLLHGVYQVLENIFVDLKLLNGRADKHPDKLKTIVKILITFILVTFAWMFFRANSLHSVILICKKFARLPFDILSYFLQIKSTGFVMTIRQAFNLGNAEMGISNEIIGFGIKACFRAFMLIIGLLFIDWWAKDEAGLEKAAKFPVIVRWLGYWLLAGTIAVSMIAGDFEPTEFIYFAF
jgi:hypothetical protein